MIKWCLCDTAAATASWAGVDLDGFFERTASGDWVRRDNSRAGSKWQPARCSHKTPDKLATVSMAKKFLYRCIGTHALVHVHFCRRVWHASRQVFWAPYMCKCVHQTSVVTSAYTFVYTLVAGCAYALMYVQFVHSAFGNEGGGVQLVYEGTCYLTWGFIFDRRRDRGVVYVFSIFNAGGSVWGCMCVYTHTHTHSSHVWYSVVSPGVGLYTWRARRIQMD